MACPDENTLVAMFERRLRDVERRTLEGHLDGCDACRTLVATFVMPEAIGRHVVLAPVGAGGMGVVYAALDPSLERRVAIKLLRAEARDDDAQAGLVREAQAMARVQHPNVVAVHDVGTIDDGQVYVVMDLIDGTSLRAWLAQARRSAEEIVRVFVDAGRGLGAAHDAGLLHRDFKPDNVLVARDGRALVADFGLTRPMGSTAERCGTPRYMAPELFEGHAADARSDEFAFCVALAEALGERAPASVRAVIARGADASPAARYPTMHALLSDLERAARGASPRRARVIGAALLALVVATIAGGSTFAILRARAPVAMTAHPPPPAADPRALAEYRAALQSLRDASNMLAIRGFERALAIDPSLGAAHVRLVYFASSSPEIEEGRAHYKAAYDRRETLDARDRAILHALEPITRDPPDTAARVRRFSALAAAYPRDAEIAWYLGEARLDAADRAGAIAELDRALALDPRFALALWAKALAQRVAGDAAGARASLDRCVAISPGAASCLRMRGWMRALAGECGAYLADARRVVEVEPDGYKAYGALAGALAANDERPEAIAQALAQKWALAPAGRPEIALFDRVDLALLRGDFTTAEREARALDAALATVPAQRPHGELVKRMASLYEETGDAARAADVARDFLARSDAWSSGLGDDPDDVIGNAVPRAIAIVARAGAMTTDAARAAREAWLAKWLARLAPAERPYLWFSAFAVPAETPDEAREALAARARFGEGLRFDDVDAAIAEAKVHVLAGDGPSARAPLERATSACVALDAPVEQVRANLLLGRVLERDGDVAGACAAYARVLSRWGDARPRSVTAESAAARVRELKCR